MRGVPTLTVALLLCAVPSAARAQAQEQDARVRAKELVKSGDLSYRLFRFDQALADYQKAYQLTSHPAIIFNIAQAYRQLKAYEKARFYYRLFLTDWRAKFPDKPPPYEEEVRGHIARLDQLVAEAAKHQAAPVRVPPPTPAPPPPARLELEGLREGSRIVVDGKPTDDGPTLALAPGRHRVRVERAGFDDWEREVKLRSGKLQTERIAMRVTDHRTLWLVTSLCATAAAGGLLAMGAYYNARHNDLLLDTPEADDARQMSVIGYSVAGGAAALAAAGWTVYLLHRRRVLRLKTEQPIASTQRGGIGLLPLPGGTMAVGTIGF